MARRLERIVALAVLAVAACGGEPEVIPEPEASAGPRPSVAVPSLPEPEPAPVPPDEFSDCTRGQQTSGSLAGLPGYRFERAAGYREIEYALLPTGPVRIVYSGCDHFYREYHFSVEEMDEASASDVFRRATDLMRALGEEVGSRAFSNAAREIEELSASGDFAIGEDLTGGMFEDDYGLGVRLESDGSAGSTLVVFQTFWI